MPKVTGPDLVSDFNTYSAFHHRGGRGGIGRNN